tara:strand:+ start:32 stop:166 length:135 start_codon:yes stop_codon:yes gene_type:complete
MDINELIAIVKKKLKTKLLLKILKLRTNLFFIKIIQEIKMENTI